jgi:hypothetical protein
MPRTRGERSPKSRARKQPPHPLPRQRPQKPLLKPTMMARERIVSQLSDLIRACEELFEQHGEECSCEGCCLVSNFVGSLRLYRMVLEIT